MSNIKNCIECGEQLSDAANFCPDCHAKQPKKLVEPKIAKAEKKITTKKHGQKSSAVGKITSVKLKKKSNYHDKRQAIYEMTSQDNCGECYCTNCMQFAMQAASKKNSMKLSDCPYIDEDEAEEFNNTFGNNDKEDDLYIDKKNKANPARGFFGIGRRKISL